MRIRCVLNYNSWGLTHFVKTRCAVNYNNWALTHLVRTRRVLNYNTWGLTHLVTGLCFESCSRTLDETGVFSRTVSIFRLANLRSGSGFLLCKNERLDTEGLHKTSFFLSLKNVFSVHFDDL